MNIICEVIREENPEIPSGPGKWDLGAIVQVREEGFTWHHDPWPDDPALLRPSQLECFVPRKSYLHVTDLPDSVTDIEHVKEVILGYYSNTEPDPSERGALVIDLTAFPPPRRDELLTEPYVLERTWAQCRGSVFKFRGGGTLRDENWIP